MGGRLYPSPFVSIWTLPDGTVEETVEMGWYDSFRAEMKMNARQARLTGYRIEEKDGAKPTAARPVGRRRR